MLSVSICLVLALSIVFFSITAGDIFLKYLGNQLGLDIIHKNHSGFVSCFLLKSIVLDNPEFKVKKSDLSIRCKEAFIEPNFKRLLDRRGIALECHLREPIFLKGGERVNIFFTELPGMDMIASFLRSVDVGAYERLFCDIELFKKNVVVNYFHLLSDDIKLYLSGTLSKDNTVDAKLKLYLSPVILDSMPGELKDILEEEGSGWASFYLELAGNQNAPSLRIESRRIRFRFGEIDEK